MSAPLVVNTKDGACWTRRTVTEGGIALYALADVCKCPEYVMATLAELAERGIVGSADVLPVPVGLGPVVQPLTLHEAQIDALAAPGNRAVNDSVHEDLCACDAWPDKCLSSGGFFQGYWDMGGLETAIPAVLGLWEQMRGGELEQLRGRVRELEAQREALAERLRAGQRWERGRNPELVSENFVSQSELRSIFGIPLAPPWADGITRRIAPTQALREDQPAEPVPVTIYRAEHPDSGITLGHYGTEAAARAHCEATERRSWPTETSLSFDWIRDALPEDDENGIAELMVTAGQNEESTTGYIVTALEVPSEYDEEADA
ncbi:MAG: hypothetical protein HOV76_29325 [Hamadaea sp.]|nr:hypothetical protein [Hamadaea sp.]